MSETLLAVDCGCFEVDADTPPRVRCRNCDHLCTVRTITASEVAAKWLETQGVTVDDLDGAAVTERAGGEQDAP